jgi:hypothetical protein
MRDNDFIYYRRRAAEEQSAAERASNLAAARAHKVIAEHYAALAESRGQSVAVEPARANDS